MGTWNVIFPALKTYEAYFHGQGGSVKIRATDDTRALWFLAQEYTCPPMALEEVITTTRQVPL